MNILALLYIREISEDDAYSFFDSWQEQFHNGEVSTPWTEQFELTDYESTAYLQGASLGDLVKLRYEGWPSVCCRCGHLLDYRQYGWSFVHNDDTAPRLRHIECQSPSEE